MKQILIILLLLLCTPITAAWDVKYTTIQNETVSIEPVIEICENTTSVFMIKRENYTSNSTPLTISYIQKMNDESRQISKTINKYSSANTGNYVVPKDGNATLDFIMNNTILKWNFLVDCNNNITNASNNITQPTLNNSNSSFNISINQSNPINNTLNQTITNQTENATMLCPTTFFITTNKDIFESKEKLEFSFLTNYWPEEYEITYWIEGIDGTIIKKEYTTTNNNTKSYTMKIIEQKEQSHIIYAKLQTNCTTIESKKIVLLQGKEQEETEEDEEQATIELKAIIDKENILIQLKANRGSESKSVLYMYLENEQRKRISEKQKITLSSKNSKVEIEFAERNVEEETIYVVLEGLGLYKEIQLEQELNKEKITTTEMEIEHEQKESTPNTQEKTTKEKDLIKAPINTTSQKNNTNEKREIHNSKEEKTIISRNILFASSIGIIFAIGTSIYFQKHSAQTTHKESR